MASEAEQARRIMAELRGLAEGAVRDIAVGVLTKAAASTPVDTGATASAWRASGRPGGPIIKRTAAAIAASKAAQEASKLKLVGYELGPKVHVGNAMPGVEALNAGSSVQEPKSFVQRAISFSLTSAKVSISARAAVGRRGRR